MDELESEMQAAMREKERASYLARLRARETWRTKAKEQTKQEEVHRAEHAATYAQTYLYRIGSRSDFRDSVRTKRLGDAKQNQERMTKLGQAYRGVLRGFVSRYLVKRPNLDKDAK